MNLKTSDKRREIINAALELMAEQGFHGAPMAMIAQRAEVAAGTIYCHFVSREALITEVYSEVEKKVVAAIAENDDQSRPLREQFIFAGARLLSYFIANPVDFRYIEQYHNSPYGASHRKDRLLGQADNRNPFQKLFQEGVARKILKDLPVNSLFALAFGPMIFLARDHIIGLALLDEELIAKCIEACWDSIKR
ncbi:MAG: TetR/AcrR family transcriptional regulator [Syntrophales bacterium]